MTTIQKIFIFSFFAFIILFSHTKTNAATYLKFDGIDGEAYAVERVEAPPTNGNHLIATHKRSGDKLILLARSGKIQSIFVQSASGEIKTLEASTATCSQGGLCTSFQIKKCFTLPSSDCFCLCGSWFANNSSNSKNEDLCLINPKNCDKGFKTKR